jgi:CheY-like chemotaxis protein
MRETSPNSVLLVDDNPGLRHSLSTYLEMEGFEARQAADGIDGLVKLRDALPKVIISDVQMPRMGGIEFISVVRRRFPFIPVIVLSGFILDESLVKAKPDVWFDKCTLNISDFLKTLRDLVRKTPDRADFPQVVSPPVRIRPDCAGYFILTCPDCLRTFNATSTLENKAIEGTAVCTYCEARVPFLMESSAPE